MATVRSTEAKRPRQTTPTGRSKTRCDRKTFRSSAKPLTGSKVNDVRSNISRPRNAVHSTTSCAA
eukprot:scaffold19144_cov63-Phaeocystis_antarctica.AAC.2